MLFRSRQDRARQRLVVHLHPALHELLVGVRMRVHVRDEAARLDTCRDDHAGERNVVVLRPERGRELVDEAEAALTGHAREAPVAVRPLARLVARELTQQVARLDQLVHVLIGVEGVREARAMDGRAVVALGRVLDPDLPVRRDLVGPALTERVAAEVEVRLRGERVELGIRLAQRQRVDVGVDEIGRASCRERV